MGFFTKDIETMDDLFVHTLRDIYYAEKQIEKALPKMIDKATNAQLKAGFEKHLEQTRGHIERVEEVFESLARVQLPGSSTRRCASAASSISSPRPGAVGRWKRPSTGRGGFVKTACMRGDGSFNSQGLVA